MRKIIRNVSTIITLLFLLVGVDMYSIYFKGKPIFIMKEEVTSLNKVYKGFLYDTYYCALYSVPQIKLKWEKYNCVTSENIGGEDSKKSAKLTLVGDLLFEQPYYDAINNKEDKNKYFNLVKEYFKQDDLSIGNMEVVIGNNDLKPSGTGYSFCAPKYIGDLVSTLDFEVLSTANNHAYDRKIEGIHSTLDYFKNNTDIITIGTYKNVNDKENLNILEIKGIKFGFLAYTYGTNQIPNEDNINLISYYKDPVTKIFSDEYKEKISKEVGALKDEVDVVIVLMHWGKEFTYEPNDEQKEMAKFLNNLGVDIIVGSHSHNIQPIEIIGDEHQTLVYYSLGNFLSADDDIARTKIGEETFDNAYQIGMLSTLEVILDEDEIEIQNIDTDLIVNYFDSNMQNFELIPYEQYSEKYEKSHLRYSKGLNRDFIDNMYRTVIDEKYR